MNKCFTALTSGLCNTIIVYRVYTKINYMRQNIQHTKYFRYHNKKCTLCD